MSADPAVGLRGLTPPARPADPAEHRRADVLSDANHRLRRVCRSLDGARSRIADFLEAHPGGCRCPWCAHPANSADDVRADLGALARVLWMVGSVTDSAVVDPDCLPPYPAGDADAPVTVAREGGAA
jgi:hypothetical protein